MTQFEQQSCVTMKNNFSRVAGLPAGGLFCDLSVGMQERAFVAVFSRFEMAVPALASDAHLLSLAPKVICSGNHFPQRGSILRLGVLQTSNHASQNAGTQISAAADVANFQGCLDTGPNRPENVPFATPSNAPELPLPPSGGCHVA